MEVMCLRRGCCVSEEEVSRLVDNLRRARRRLEELSQGGDELRYMLRRVELGERALSKVLGGVKALRSRFKNVGRIEDVGDPGGVVNTVINMLNRIVEVRNIVSEARDRLEELGVPQGVARLFEELIPELDRVTLKLSLVALRIALRIGPLTRDDSGRLASAIGTAVFASLLSAHVDRVRRAVAMCLP